MKPNRLNILTVEDEAGIRSLLRAVIIEEGHNSFDAANGLEALEIIKTVNPHLVFMDIKMPVMDGIKSLEKLKQLKCKPDVVVMSVFTEKELINKAYQYGAVKCIDKPFNLDDIREIIRQAAQKNCGKQE